MLLRSVGNDHTTAWMLCCLEISSSKQLDYPWIRLHLTNNWIVLEFSFTLLTIGLSLNLASSYFSWNRQKTARFFTRIQHEGPVRPFLNTYLVIRLHFLPAFLSKYCLPHVYENGPLNSAYIMLGFCSLQLKTLLCYSHKSVSKAYKPHDEAVKATALLTTKFLDLLLFWLLWQNT